MSKNKIIKISMTTSFKTIFVIFSLLFLDCLFFFYLVKLILFQKEVTNKSFLTTTWTKSRGLKEMEISRLRRFERFWRQKNTKYALAKVSHFQQTTSTALGCMETFGYFFCEFFWICSFFDYAIEFSEFTLIMLTYLTLEFVPKKINFRKLQ